MFVFCFYFRHVYATESGGAKSGIQSQQEQKNLQFRLSQNTEFAQANDSKT
jgi:hypothetical protein